MNYNILSYSLAGNTIKMYAIFIALIVGSIILLKIFRYIIFSRIKKHAKETNSKIDDLIIDSLQKNIIPMMYVIAIYLSTGAISIGIGVDKQIEHLFLILITYFITRFLISLAIFFANRFWLVKDENNGVNSITILLNMVIRIIIWSISLLILLDNLGIKVSGLIAGFGVGGVAIAFAAQSILADVFNYFTIFFDRPFEIGDLLFIDKFSGVVEHIGVKTTRIRSLGGEELIFSNTDLTGSRVRNFKNMRERRVVFSFGVTYQTPVRKMKIIPEEIKKIIDNIESAKFDRAHFYKFGDSSLDFEIVFYVLSGEYLTYMEIQQEINLKIMMLFEKMKVEFAYPTRTVFMHK